MARFRVPFANLPIPPALRVLPAPTIRIIALLVTINIILWIVAGIILHFHPSLISPAALSYVLGLRHALDADHISAIDLMTRRLIASGQRPVTVGTFFSLGHSTIVIVTCVVVAATSGALRDRFDGFTRVGNIIGTSVSAAFLLLLCAGNGWVLYKLIRRLKVVLEEERRRGMEGYTPTEEDEGDAATNLKLEGEGFLANVFRKVFRVVDRPWKMFPLGILFGLGFDTSSEIAILGLSSVHGAQGTSIWLILIFPVLFTAGMCLLDTTDGALMMALYTSKAFSRDRVAILYYSIVLTGITVFVSAFIGIIQVLSLIANVAEPEGSFWDGVDAIGEHFDIIGGSICGLFVVVGLGSVVVYRPWRKSIDKKNQERAVLVPEEERGLGAGEGPSYGAVEPGEPVLKKGVVTTESDVQA
ncbi:Ni2+-Co2+ transporter transition metal uptake transporter [Colletotrichum godetiae]|uniref:Nickel/cobalt efflux system n=1 Tax=Colletotrichum godetiae TaxID=1209918 RepID=A0AAJ0APP2_9PEZI|nr:Ni2+-Co2+ transporter transition metal uptake transporter [Colletotrichum godetiae]KAK1676247.1 Ni2+-Co2+ transporter transition metal uptake transporter [Colletotrichum godetiae]